MVLDSSKSSYIHDSKPMVSFMVVSFEILIIVERSNLIMRITYASSLGPTWIEEVLCIYWNIVKWKKMAWWQKKRKISWHTCEESLTLKFPSRQSWFKE
jgi:hypothetical protein